MPTTLLHISELNEPVTFSQSRRARRLSITVRPFKGIRVAYPTTQTIQQAQNYLHKNIDWAKKSITNIRKIEQEHQSTIHPDYYPKDLTYAKSVITNRLKELAGKHNFTYNDATVKSIV
jgi:hypothetical protein